MKKLLIFGAIAFCFNALGQDLLRFRNDRINGITYIEFRANENEEWKKIDDHQMNASYVDVEALPEGSEQAEEGIMCTYLDDVCYYMFCEGMESFYVAKTCGDAQFQEEWMWEDLVEGNRFNGEMERQAANMANESYKQCYEFSGETLFEHITLDYDYEGDNQISGVIDASIEDEENGYYATYYVDFTGEIANGVLSVSGTMEIEGYVEEFTGTWSLKDGGPLDGGPKLIKDGNTYYHSTCPE